MQEDIIYLNIEYRVCLCRCYYIISLSLSNEDIKRYNFNYNLKKYCIVILLTYLTNKKYFSVHKIYFIKIDCLKANH